MPKAFPTAEGFGAGALGARFGTPQVLRVTNLNDSGTGSFRAAVMTDVPRFIYFDVAGIISLQSSILCPYSYMYLAGQTAPGDGIIVTNTTVGTPCGFQLVGGCHDIIIRHMRFYVRGPNPSGEGETFSVYGQASGDANTVHDIIVDHCSVMYGSDGQMSAYGNWDNITFQYCLDAYALHSTNDGMLPGNGGRGMYVSGFSGDYVDKARITIHHNVLANNGIRNPRITRSGVADLVNNLVYNWRGNGNAFVAGDSSDNHSGKVNLRSNIWKYGPESGTNKPLYVYNGQGAGETLDRGGTKVYTDGLNWGDQQTGDDWDEVRDGDTGAPPDPASEAIYRLSTPLPTPGADVTLTPTANLQALLLPTVGASKPVRLSFDTTVITHIQNGTGSMASSTPTLPTLASGSLPADANNDGIPDSWAIARGFTATDTIANTLGPGGWTYRELYLSERAGDPSQFAAGSLPVRVQTSPMAETASGNALVPTLSGVTAANLLLYVATCRIVGTTPTLGTPTNFTQLVQSITQNNQRLALGYRENVPAGSHAPSIAMPTAARGSAVLVEFSGVKMGGVKVATSSTFPATETTPTTGTVTPTGPAALVVGAVSHSGTTTTITPDDPWDDGQIFEDETVDVGLPLNIVMRTALTGAIEVGWTFGGGKACVAAIVALEGVATASPACRVHRLQAGNRYAGRCMGRGNVQGF